MTDLRKVEKKVGDSWVSTEMKELAVGDIFRMFEPNGEPVEWHGFEWIVKGKPYLNESSVYAVNVEEILEVVE